MSHDLLVQMAYSSTESKVRTTFLINKIVPFESIAEERVKLKEVLREWSYRRVLFKDSKVRTPY